VIPKLTITIELECAGVGYDAFAESLADETSLLRDLETRRESLEPLIVGAFDDALAELQRRAIRFEMGTAL
jgi:hypothetical protein